MPVDLQNKSHLLISKASTSTYIDMLRKDNPVPSEKADKQDNVPLPTDPVTVMRKLSELSNIVAQLQREITSIKKH